MFSLSSIKPTTALVTGGGVIVLLMLFIIQVGLSRISDIESQFEAVVTNENQKLSLSSRMIYLARERTLLLHQLLDIKDPFVLDQHFLKFREYGSEFLKKREHLLKLKLSNEEQVLIAQQAQMTAIASSAQYKVIDAIQKGDIDSAHNILFEEVVPAQSSAMAPLLDLAELQRLSGQQALDTSSTAIKRAIVQFTILFTGVLLISLFIGSFVIKRIAQINRNLEHSHYKLEITNDALERRLDDLDQAQSDLRRSRAREHATLNNILDGIITINEEGIMQSANPAAQKMFGYSEQEMIGQNVAMLMPSDQRQEHDHYVRGSKLEGRKALGKVRDLVGVRKDGSEFPLDIGLSRASYDGQVEIIGVLRDITERKKSEEILKRSHEELEALVQKRTRELEAANTRLLQMANYDNLTGLANRTLLLEHIKLALANARRHNTLVAILFLDLDGFKAINDSLGHEAGDQLLQEVARRLNNSVRENDSVARFGGDEFVVLLGDLQQPLDANPVAEKIIEAVKRPITLAEQQVSVGTSIGIALYPHDSDKTEELIQLADKAMYQVKRQGKDSYRYYDAKLPVS